jgi:hypothetical protein
MHKDTRCLLTQDISLQVKPLEIQKSTLTFKKLAHIEGKGFRTKEMNYLKPRQVDLELCKTYLAQIHSEHQGIGISLIFFLTHYKFENTFTKTYIKKLLEELNN